MPPAPKALTVPCYSFVFLNFRWHEHKRRNQAKRMAPLPWDESRLKGFCVYYLESHWIRLPVSVGGNSGWGVSSPLQSILIKFDTDGTLEESNLN